jgi:hypothetical protein
MTKLVLGQQQYIRSKSVKSSDETAVKKYETNKILSMRRITDWEKNIFIPQAEKLLSTFGHSYILDAINQSCGPIPLHSNLIISASELLINCLRDERLSLGKRTLDQIEDWFYFVNNLERERSLLWTSFDEGTRAHIAHVLEQYYEYVDEEIPPGESDFLHFSTRSLILIHAFVVYLRYGSPRNITTKRYKGTNGVTRKRKRVRKDGPAKDKMNNEKDESRDAQNGTHEDDDKMNNEKDASRDTQNGTHEDDEDDDEEGEVDDGERKENDDHISDSDDESKDAIHESHEDSEDDDVDREKDDVEREENADHISDSDDESKDALHESHEDSEEDKVDREECDDSKGCDDCDDNLDEAPWLNVEQYATCWISEFTDWSEASYSLISPLFGIETWRKNRIEEMFPYLGLRPYQQFSGQPCTSTLRPHEIFHQTLELIFAKFTQCEHLQGSVQGSKQQSTQFQILFTTFDILKKASQTIQKKISNREKFARSNLMKENPKSRSDETKFENFTFLFGDHYGVAFVKLLYVPTGDEFFAGAY